jgi:hypothetical protein
MHSLLLPRSGVVRSTTIRFFFGSRSTSVAIYRLQRKSAFAEEIKRMGNAYERASQNWDFKTAMTR